MSDNCKRCGRPTDGNPLPTVTETEQNEGETIERVYCSPACLGKEHGMVYPGIVRPDATPPREPILPFWDSGIRCDSTTGESIGGDFETDFTIPPDTSADTRTYVIGSGDA